MYQVMAIANYEDRFVIPSSHKEMVENAFEDKASCGFTFGNGCSDGHSNESLFGRKKPRRLSFTTCAATARARPGNNAMSTPTHPLSYRVLSLLLDWNSR